jgi:pantetheine-phosphate adenylyltransferase
MVTAVYPGSFDPVHNGHIDVAERASRLFDRLLVAVFAQPAKNILFDVEERTEMLRQALQHLPNVTATCYDGMTVNFLHEQNAQVMVRGLRMMYDFDREYQMALTNQAFAPDIETICLFSTLHNSFLSSSKIKEIARAGGDVAHMVPAHVVAALERKGIRPSLGETGRLNRREGR